MKRYLHPRAWAQWDDTIRLSDESGRLPLTIVTRAAVAAYLDRRKLSRRETRAFVINRIDLIDAARSRKLRGNAPVMIETGDL